MTTGFLVVLLVLFLAAVAAALIFLHRKHRIAARVDDSQKAISFVDTNVELGQTETPQGANRETGKAASEPISGVEKIVPSSEEEESDSNNQSNPLPGEGSQTPTSDGMESSSSIEDKQTTSGPEDLEATDPEYVSPEKASAVAEADNAVDPGLRVREPSQVQPEVVQASDAKSEVGNDQEWKDETPAPEEVQSGEGQVVGSTAATMTSNGDDSPASVSEQLDVERVSDEVDHERKTPRKYTGIDRTPPQPQETDREKARSKDREPTRRDRALSIEVRLRFDRSGFCAVSLIAKRSSGLPDEMAVSAQWGEVDLRAMQDEWYQDIVPSNLAEVLRKGAVWTQEGENGQCIWSLSGHELYVLASRTDISGYVSQACLDLGREHVVLCSEEVRSAVEEAIHATGGMPTAILDETLGAPPGWVVFRKVIPKNSVTPVAQTDIFNALRPIPRIKISLEGGIRLGYVNWLEEHPPRILVYGDPEHTTDVRIDGHTATCGEGDTYRVAGWDSVGTHLIWCAGTRKSYSIVPFVASWEHWDAHPFPISRSRDRLSICGPLVRAVSVDQQGQAPSVSVPETNPILLGQFPGEYALAARVSGIHGAPCIATPRFQPVWALPSDPLHCDNAAVRILFVGEEGALPKMDSRSTTKRLGRHTGVDTWCCQILDANRKGLRTEPDTEVVRALWLSYKRVARRIWRARK